MSVSPLPNFRTMGRVVVVLVAGVAVPAILALGGCQYVVGIDPIGEEDGGDGTDRRACLDGRSYDPNPATGIRYRLDNDRVSWQQARDQCASDDAHLVTLETPEENMYVAGLTVDTVWMGLTDEDVEDTFVWVTGEPLGAFVNWSTGQPDDAADEDFGEMFSSGTWNDNQATEVKGFVCECPP